MTPEGAWSIVESPVTTIGLGVLFTIGAFALLREYRRLFMENPQSAMSAEVLLAVISRSGGPGYLAAVLLAAGLLNVIFGLYSLISALSYGFVSF
jgi:hypothetical protein